MLFKITLDRKHNNIYIILAEVPGVARGIYNHKFCLAFVTPGGYHCYPWGYQVSEKNSANLVQPFDQLHINSEKLYDIDHKKYM